MSRSGLLTRRLVPPSSTATAEVGEAAVQHDNGSHAQHRDLAPAGQGADNHSSGTTFPDTNLGGGLVNQEVNLPSPAKCTPPSSSRHFQMDHKGAPYDISMPPELTPPDAPPATAHQNSTSQPGNPVNPVSSPPPSPSSAISSGPGSTMHDGSSPEAGSPHQRHTIHTSEDEDPTLSVWGKQYPLPEETAAGSLVERKHLYRPPRSDAQGIAVACTVIGVWAVLFYHALFQVKLEGPDRSSWLHVAAVFAALEFMYTGLFITTHDAMHGTIAYRHRKLNDFLGSLAISLYAWFDYSMLHRKHWEHHNHTGLVGKDPDFHRGDHALLPWFIRFMLEYMTVMQFVKITACGNLLMFLGVPMANLVTFMAGAGLVSAFRLFYYGTYVPHCPTEGGKETMPWQKSRTSPAGSLRSFLTCYHFDYHWEHHRWPYAPWWELQKCKVLSGR